MMMNRISGRILSIFEDALRGPLTSRVGLEKYQSSREETKITSDAVDSKTNGTILQNPTRFEQDILHKVSLSRGDLAY